MIITKKPPHKIKQHTKNNKRVSKRIKGKKYEPKRDFVENERKRFIQKQKNQERKRERYGINPEDMI